MAHTGEVKSFNATKGYGFIVSPSGHGKDIFLPKRALPPGADARPGDQIAFDITEEATGPVAGNISFMNRNAGLNALNTGGGRPGSSITTIAIGAVLGGGPGSIIPGNGPTDPFYGMGYLGTVKSCNREKGSGFIESGVMKELYGKDAFFSFKLLNGGAINPGDRVFFAIRVEEKGPTCTMMEVVSSNAGVSAFPQPGYQSQFGLSFPGAPQPGAGYGPVGNRGRPQLPPAMPQMFQQPMRNTFMPEAKGSKSAAAAQNTNTRHFGQVKTFNEEKGWGHIDSEAAKNAFGKDIFLMRQELPEGRSAQAGDLISFKVVQGQKGPKAVEVMLLPPMAFAVGGNPGSVYYGTIKSFSAEKKWGFVAGEQISSVFGKDIFCNLREFVEGDQYAPQVGDEVSFTVEIEVNGGRPEAKQINLAAGAAGGDLRSQPY